MKTAEKKLIFKVVACGDVLYIQAKTQREAEARLEEFMGEIPKSLLTWSEVAELPEGEEFL